MRTFILAVMSLVWFHNTALACMGPEYEDHHYPSCTIPLPAPDERVTVIESGGRSALSSLHLGRPDRKTRVVVVNVAPSSDRHYLLLGASGQTIWQIEGDTDNISRVVVFGARHIGPNGAGVIGLPADRIHFTSPEPVLLKMIENTSCTRIFQACTSAQWFGPQPRDQVSFHPISTQPRLQSDAFISPQFGLQSDPDSRVSIIYPAIAGTVISIDPATVVSPEPAQPYAVMPGRPGLQALVKTGALVPRGAGIYHRMVNDYAETFSARYRSRFDPEFIFTPHVDFIVTRAITLPPELPPTALLVARGVPAPAYNGNSFFRVCLYFEDQASKPVMSDAHNSVLCRRQGWPRRDHDRDILSAARAFDTAGTGADCRLAPIPADTHIAVVALSEQPHRRYRDDPIRQIDVDVGRDGPVALYLSIEGGPVRWNVTGANVVAVYMRAGTDFGMHQVLLNGEPYEQIRLGKDTQDCPFFPPSFPNRLGPSIAQLDQMFDTLTGQRIDQLITRTDKGRALATSGAQIPRYVVK